MKERKNDLSFRVMVAFAILGAIQVTGIAAAVFVGVASGTLGMLLGFVLVMLALLVAAWLLIHLAIVKPYERLVELQRMFLDEKIYDELFMQRVRISPEVEQVMERFRHLLSKQDIINLSKKQAEYLALQNQINPHFLYNTLEAIRGDALGAGQREIAQTAEALAIYFRYTITEMGDLVTLEEELENIENYFIIQQYRFGEKLEIRVHTDEESVYRCRIPKLTLQPIVENAIFHGLENKAEGGWISISTQATQKRIVISIKDNGVGMSQEDVESINEKLEKVKVSYINEKKRTGGIALRNVAQRIKLLFGEEYGLQLYSARGVGTEVIISLPKIMQ